MSLWKQYDIYSKVKAILDTVHYNHHFGGRPFLTAYQLAAEFAKKYPAEFAAIGKPIGGAGTGQATSLSQYVAKELSQRIKSQEITDIEGSFLANLNLDGVTITGPNGIITSSLTASPYPVSLYRLKESAP